MQQDRMQQDRRNQSGQQNEDSGNAKQGIVLWGYDKAAKEYTVAWSGSDSTAVRFDKGELNDENQLVMTGEFTDPETDDKYQTRTVFEIMSPDRQKLTMYVDGGLFATEKKAFEITYRRDAAFNGFGDAEQGNNEYDANRRNQEQDRDRNQDWDRNRDWDRDQDWDRDRD